MCVVISAMRVCSFVRIVLVYVATNLYNMRSNDANAQGNNCNGALGMLAATGPPFMFAATFHAISFVRISIVCFSFDEEQMSSMFPGVSSVFEPAFSNFESTVGMLS